MTERRGYTKVLQYFAELFDPSRCTRPAEGGVLRDSVDEGEAGSANHNGTIEGSCMRFTRVSTERS